MPRAPRRVQDESIEKGRRERSAKGGGGSCSHPFLSDRIDLAPPHAGNDAMARRADTGARSPSSSPPAAVPGQTVATVGPVSASTIAAWMPVLTTPGRNERRETNHGRRD